MKKLFLLLFFPFSIVAQIHIDDLFTIPKVNQLSAVSDSSVKFIGSLKKAKILSLNTQKNVLLLNNNSHFKISIPTQNDGIIQLELEPCKIFAPDFKVLTPKGAYKMNLPVFYRGKIVDQQKSFVAITITQQSFEGLIISENYNYTIGAIKNAGNSAHIIYKTDEIPNKIPLETQDITQIIRPDIQSDLQQSEQLNIINLSQNKSVTKNAGEFVGTVRVALEADYDMYNGSGSNMPEVVNLITSIFNNVSLLYANENINLVLSSLFVWTELDPYANATWVTDALDLFAKKPAINGDLAHLVSTKQMGGGLAYINTGAPVYGTMTSRAVFSNCADQSRAYGVSSGIIRSVESVPTYSWNVSVIAHELGHNFGLPHTHSCTWPSGAIDNCGSYAAEGNCSLPNTPVGSGTIMSFCQNTNIGINFLNGFGQQPGDKMRAEVEAATCLSRTCSTADFAALKAFYTAMNGDNWTNKTGWSYVKNNSTPPTNCSFTGIFGVTTALIEGRERVIKIELPNNNLVGVIPEKIGALINLEILNLSNNKINGAIHPVLGSLSKLQTLNLGNNQLAGTIPSTLGNLYSLQQLYLNNNQLTGCYSNKLKVLCWQLSAQNISTGNTGLAATWSNFCTYDLGTCLNVVSAADYSALRDFYFSTNGDEWVSKYGWSTIRDNAVAPSNFNFSNINGIKSAIIDGVERVTGISFSFNWLYGSLPASLGNITHLEEINLRANNLTGSIPETIGNLKNLKYLNLDQNQLTGPIPAQIGNATSLQALSLARNELNGSIPLEVEYLSNLRYLNLAENDLLGYIPWQLGSLKNLVKLDLNYNELVGNIPVELFNLGLLEELNLGTNRLTGEIPSEVVKLVNLQTLDLKSNKLSGTIPTVLGDMFNLRHLSLYGNRLVGGIPAELGRIPKLLNLYLDQNNLTGTIPSELGNLSSLQRLHLGGNQLSGTIPLSLFNLTGLIDLILGNNTLSGSIPTQVGNLINLQYLSLGYNYLSGNIPSTIGNLTNLFYLGIHDNSLSGGIPANIGNLTELRSLTLSNSRLSGSLPASIGSLKNIEGLFLRDNFFSGTIPEELGELANVPGFQYINLINNSLSGCFSENLKKLCGKSVSIRENTGLLATWEDFCTNGAGQCPCPQSFTLQSPTNDINSGIKMFKVDKTIGQITASNQITGSANITYSVGKSILLTPGFVANKGTVFKTEKGGCN